MGYTRNRCETQIGRCVKRKQQFPGLQTMMILAMFVQVVLVSAIDLIPDSSTKRIDAQLLEHKTEKFLRYARNEIFARHGYVFSDPDLALYFQHQGWYRENPEKLELSVVEKENVALLEKQEREGGHGTARIIKRLSVDGFPVIFVTYRTNWQELGDFYVFSRKDLWVLKCLSIPPESLEQMSIAISGLEDIGSPFVSGQIRRVDLNEPCESNTTSELLVDSDFPHFHAILGFVDGLFMKLFNFGGTRGSWKCRSGNMVELNLTVRHELLEPMFSEETYLLDLKTGEFWIPKGAQIRFKLFTKSKAEVAYYGTKEGASCQDEEDKAGTLPPGKELTFLKYFSGINGQSVYFESSTTKGWIYYPDAKNWGNFQFYPID